MSDLDKVALLEALGVTADVIPERLDVYPAAGMDLVLSKPFRKARLLQFVADVSAKSGAVALPEA